jgi:hypothetical protein
VDISAATGRVGENTMPVRCLIMGAWSFRVALRSQPIYAPASLQPLINFSFALKPLNVPNFGSGVMSLDLPVALCDALVFENDPRRFAHGHQYAVVRNRPLGRSIRLFKPMDMLAHQEKSLFNSSVRATFPALFADTVVSK